jgi:hypothetical protein
VADVAARLEVPAEAGGGTRPVAMMLGMLVALAIIGRALYMRGRPEPMIDVDGEDAA